MIPMVDLKKQFNDIREEVMDALKDILEGTQFILGPKVRELEEKIAGYHGVKEAVGVASGTDALHLSLKVLGIGEGDEVITTPFTFFATVEAILYVGAKPVFADIEPDTFNLNASEVEKKITKKTKAVIPVHMFGHPADMEKIREAASRHNLKVIEDCAQSFGASIAGRKTGSLGDAGCFSFYPTKNLGAYGDGGMIILNDKGAAEEARSLRNHGSKGGYIHGSVGFNSRLDEIQAGILLVKFKRIDDYNLKRRQKAALYTKLLSGKGCEPLGKVTCPSERPGAYHVYHQYTVTSPKRDELQAVLKENGISSTVYYPVPMHLQEALRGFGYKEGDFPAAERAAREVLSLPIYPELEDFDIGRIAGILNSV
ncbi:MAG: DegT/DnrJ/EryC1/StrS family aminotransferase [Thermodesulfovibrionales bacterium]|nr:DegT/DnrJ/EryC1/StrS family aminotransferase [Thermodesulfovibrionales bacterium]